MRAVVLVALAIVLGACARSQSREHVAVQYGRALYAGDADAIWRLVSDADRRMKDLATFRRQQHDLAGFTRQAVRQLAGYISAVPVKTTLTGDRATVTLTFRLPDANAPAIGALLHDWDEERLNGLAADERRQIREHLDRLHREGRLPTIEGDETVELVREASRWKIFLNWAGGVRVHFAGAVDPRLPVQLTVNPTFAILAPGERIRVTVEARNTGSTEVRTRVRHDIEPTGQAAHLALLQCPLFLPVTLKPGTTREFVSEYLLLADVPVDVRALDVTYRFPATSAGTGRGEVLHSVLVD